MTPTKRFLFLLLFTGIGIAFGVGFGIAFYYIRKKKDEDITISSSINEIIAPSISFWVTIGILLILKCAYGTHLNLFIMSAIILASFLYGIFPVFISSLIILGFLFYIDGLFAIFFLIWFLGSFLASISSKTVWLFFLGIGAIIFKLGFGQLINMLIDYLNNRAKNMKAENIPENNAPQASAPPMNNLNQPMVKISNDYYNLRPNAPQASAPPNE